MHSTLRLLQRYFLSIMIIYTYLYMSEHDLNLSFRAKSEGKVCKWLVSILL